jgi:hypothetical protein
MSYTYYFFLESLQFRDSDDDYPFTSDKLSDSFITNDKIHGKEIVKKIIGEYLDTLKYDTYIPVQYEYEIYEIQSPIEYRNEDSLYLKCDVGPNRERDYTKIFGSMGECIKQLTDECVSIEEYDEHYPEFGLLGRTPCFEQIQIFSIRYCHK